MKKFHCALIRRIIFTILLRKKENYSLWKEILKINIFPNIQKFSELK